MPISETNNRPSVHSASSLLERTFTRLFMRPALVTEATDLSEKFRYISLQSEALKECSWKPGDKVQVKLGKGIITRTYTPISWNMDKGETQLLVYCHGEGPGSAWATDVSPGDERQLFGPRNSISLNHLTSTTILFGDETTFALALALEQAATPGALHRHYVFEVTDREEAASVLRQLGLPSPVLVQKCDGNEHLENLTDVLRDFIQPDSTFVLCGKAASIQHVNRMLKAQGVKIHNRRTKAYWAPGKTGLD